MIITNHRIGKWHLVILAVILCSIGFLAIREMSNHGPQQSPPVVAWMVQLDPNASEEFIGESAAVGSDGCIYVVESDTGWMWKLDQGGKVRWKKQLLPGSIDKRFEVIRGDDSKLYIRTGGPDSNYSSIAGLRLDGRLSTQHTNVSYTDERPMDSIVIDKHGQVNAAGTMLFSNDKVCIEKYDRHGKLLWSRTPSLGHGMNWIGDLGCLSVDVDRAGSMYIAGSPVDTTGEIYSNGFLGRVTPSGRVKWLATTDLGKGVEPVAVSVADNNTIYVTGNVETQKLSKANGKSVIERISRRVNNWRIKRNRRQSGERDFFIAQYNSSGKRQWFERLRTSADDEAWKITTDKEGNAYVVGYECIERLTSGRQFVAKYSAHGSLLWQKEFFPDGEGAIDNISPDKNGNVYVFGTLEGSSKYFVAKLVER